MTYLSGVSCLTVEAVDILLTLKDAAIRLLIVA